MISDLPIFQITDETTKEKVGNSLMEISYMVSDANGGDQQTRYKSMAIPLGVLFNALMMSNYQSNTKFSDKCLFQGGLDLSGDIAVNQGVEQNDSRMALSMKDCELDCNQLKLMFNNLLVGNHNGTTPILEYRNDNTVEFKDGIVLKCTVPETATTPLAETQVVNVKYLNEFFRKKFIEGTLFEIHQLDYIAEVEGWVRINADKWLY